MQFYYHLLHITKRLYVSHNGGCVAQVRHKKAPHLSAGGVISLGCPRAHF